VPVRRGRQEVVVIPARPDQQSPAAILPIGVVVWAAPALGRARPIAVIGMETGETPAALQGLLIHRDTVNQIAAGSGFQANEIKQEVTFPTGNARATEGTSHGNILEKSKIRSHGNLRTR
jgi:hypothetical protein